jgi:pimeloyl-ACP methyl ester carboxylesterase
MKRLLVGLLVLVGIAAALLAGGYFALKRPDLPYATLAERYQSDASRYVDLPGGIHMHYRDQGQGPILLLIHGYSASLHTWEPWVERLATGDNRVGDYRVISIDLPGHGLTSAPADYQASIAGYVDVVAEFVRSQNLEHFAIAGNSMGGGVAWEYALAHPDQVQALILVDAAGWPHPDEASAMNTPMMKALSNPTIGPMLRDLDSTQIFRQGVRASFANPDLADDAMVTRYVDLSRAPGHRDILRQLRMNFSERRVASDEALSPITAPTLILWGAEDHLIPVADAEKFHSAIHGSEVTVYDNAGHILQEEKPDDTAMAVHEFLYRVYEGSALAAE